MATGSSPSLQRSSGRADDITLSWPPLVLATPLDSTLLGPLDDLGLVASLRGLLGLLPFSAQQRRYSKYRRDLEQTSTNDNYLYKITICTLCSVLTIILIIITGAGLNNREHN